MLFFNQLIFSWKSLYWDVLCLVKLKSNLLSVSSVFFHKKYPCWTLTCRQSSLICKKFFLISQYVFKMLHLVLICLCVNTFLFCFLILFVFLSIIFASWPCLNQRFLADIRNGTNLVNRVQLQTYKFSKLQCNNSRRNICV